MVWVCITWLAALAALLEVIHRAPRLEDFEQRAEVSAKERASGILSQSDALKVRRSQSVVDNELV
jgi:hypothetical protein